MGKSSHRSSTEENAVYSVIRRWERRESRSAMLERKCQDLLAQLVHWQPAVIAFSGGVDSSVLAGMTTVATGQPVDLVTAGGPAFSNRQAQWAREVVAYLGAKHEIIDAGELGSDGYVQNGIDRCYYCKSQLYQSIGLIQARFGGRRIMSGTNQDDLKDYRPGLKAADEQQVVAPLAEFELGKDEVRELARCLGLPNADIPAAPCLASRIQYGVTVSQERLARIEAAEDYLWSRQFTDVRVRLLEGDVASVEVPQAEVPRLTEGSERKQLEEKLLKLGFTLVQLCPGGLQSGRLNQLAGLRSGGAGHRA